MDMDEEDDEEDAKSGHITMSTCEPSLCESMATSVDFSTGSSIAICLCVLSATGLDINAKAKYLFRLQDVVDEDDDAKA